MRIVYAEGVEQRVLKAAAQLCDLKLARPLLVGEHGPLAEAARAHGVTLEGIEVRDPATEAAAGRLAGAYHELRRHKGVTEDEAGARSRLPHY